MKTQLSALAAGVLTLANAIAAEGADASLAGASVVITGQRAVLAKSIAAQDKADNIINVLSSDDIGNLPDKNAAEALARLPGVSVQRDQGEGRYITVRGLGPDLNAVTINGALVPSPEASRRAVALDVLPAGLIRSLEVTKTLTPEQDASSLGGTVEVKSLSAFDLPGSLLTVNAAASHDQNTGKNSPSAGMLWASRFGDGKFGVAVGLGGERRKFGSDNVETGGAWDGERLSGFELRDYLPVRERRAAALNLDYLPQAGNSWFLRTFLSRFSDDEVRDRLTVSNVSGGTLAEGVPASARLERRIRQRKYTQEIQSAVLGTQQKLGAWLLGVQAGRSKADEDTPEALNDGRFRGAANFKGISFTNGERPALTAPASAYDPSSYSLNAITLQQRYSKDTGQHLKFDLGHVFELGEMHAALKFGAKASRREKTSDSNQWSYGSKAVSGSLSMASFVQGRQLDYPFGQIGAAIDPAAIRARVAGLDRNAARLAAESAINDFALNEDIDSAYFQNTLSQGDWRLLAGVRAEHTAFDASGVRVNGSAITPLRRSRSYTSWLPSLQLRYDLDRSTSLRSAWTNSVVRANFSQLAPGVALASATEATIGNPDLNPLKSHNLDLGVERVIGNDGMLSAYLFYKDIKDFTYTTNLAGSGQWAGYTSATTYANGDTAKVKGLELSWQQPLRMLPAPFNGLLVGANGAVTGSRANIARFDSKAGAMLGRRIPMPGQSDRVMNLMLGYEAGPVSTRIALNTKSPYLLELGSDLLNGAQDRIVDTQKQVDFSLSWQLSKGLQLGFDVANLGNEKYYVYQGVKSHNAQYEQYGRTYKLGLKASVF
ncbi:MULTISPECIES: TonB-dependent receptor [unclassified Duganella]|uniref:TonB-dependent receptor n=1 Tax=unclassified Duganella TaxID=2636909 RepID=UPI0006FEB8A9|nr:MULTISPECIES: TonB-dependent receptor [unclassified Duganella]KQV61395.1 TonB-dependent receptor [Duganella sp. Root336D2]KRB92651.1 TonB-dependent receptor [Duganella sp. Root198D2]